jgi:chitodextrinase
MRTASRQPLRRRLTGVCLSTALVVLLTSVAQAGVRPVIVPPGTFLPVADAYVNSAKPNANYGQSVKLKTESVPQMLSYMRFDLRRVTGSISRATLVVYSSTASSAGFEVHSVTDDGWEERSITYRNAPAFSSVSASTSGSILGRDWSSVDVTSLVAGGGLLSIALTPRPAADVTLASRESNSKGPMLLVETASADSTAPSTPANLAVTGATPTSVTLSWSPSSDNVGVAGYGLYEDGALVGSTTSTSATFSGLFCGTSYTLGVDAYDAADNRSTRSSVTVATSACPDIQPPTAPSGLATTASTQTSISLSWSASTDDVGVAGYGVYRNGVLYGSTALRSYVVQGLTCGTSYTLAVDAYDAAQNRSARTSIVATTSACSGDSTPPTAPGGPTITATSATSVSLSWSPSSDNVGVTGYGLYRNATSVGSTTQTTYTFQNLSCGTSYTFAVDAFDAAGNRSAKASVIAATSACPDTIPPLQPANLMVTAISQTTATLGWSPSLDNIGVAGYGLYRNGTLVGSTSLTSSTFQGLSCGSSYTLGVDAYDAAGNRSAQASVVVATSSCSSTPPAGDVTLPVRAAFYYPWFPETWSVNGVHVSYHPSLGYYDSSNQAVAAAHVKALDYAKVNVAIASWWGVGTHSESPRLPLLLDTTTSAGSPLKWALYYEPEGQGNPTVSQLQADLSYIKTSYAGRSAYARVGGKPVIFVYNGNDTTCEVADRWKQATAGQWYVMLKIFSGYRTCASQPDGWHQYAPAVAADSQQGFSYSISPGFWRADESQPRLARDPARWQQNIRDMIASQAPWQLVTTFNEWGEGTAVESAQEWATASGYGSYLDALHDDGQTTAPADTTPPSTPSALRLSGATDTSLSLSWTASTDNVGVMGYRVFVDGASKATTNGTSYTFGGLSCGKSYTLGVEAYDAAGNVSTRATLSGSTAACPASSGDSTPPSTPSALKLSGATDTSLSLSWTASTDNVGVTGYRVFVDGASKATTNGTSYTFGGLSCGKSYTLGVEAYDAAGNVSTRATLAGSTAACPPPPPSANDPVITAAGDIACSPSTTKATNACHQLETSDLIRAINPTAALTLGDNQYDSGELANYQQMYDPSWGRFKATTRPAPGNHEYNTSGAAGYFAYFDNPPAYYSYDLGSWHLISLNSEIGHDATSEQVTWLKNDLASTTKACVLAYWHKPRFTSGTGHSSDSSFDPFWQALYAANAEIVLSGHVHNYERFAPQNPAGGADPMRGIREFVAGTGGRNHYSKGSPIANSEVQNDNTFGVLKLTLHPNGYDFEFVPDTSSGSFTDAGSGACH